MVKHKQAVDITTEADLDAALKRAKAHDNGPLARTVKYVQDHNLLIIGLNNGQRLILPLEDVPELKGLTKKQFANWELLGRGTAINFPGIHVALPIDGIIEGIYGRRRWMAEVGSKGGQAKTGAKQLAARTNGAKGGRPKKTEVAKAAPKTAAARAGVRSPRSTLPT
jgi:hypothetical protein